MEHDDAVSVAMFWAGALMALGPLIIAAVVVAVVRHQRRSEARRRAREAGNDERAPGAPSRSTGGP
jgi:hypothetical protein